MNPSPAPWTKRQIAITAVAITLLLALAWFYLRPHARQVTHGFVAYYVVSHILAFSPGDLAAAYEPAWFATAIARAVTPAVQEVFTVQPPTMSLLLLPLVWLSHGAAREVWLGLSLLFLIAGLMLLADALALPRRWGLWAAPIMFLFLPVREVLRMGQAYLFLFLLLCLVFWAVLRQPASRFANLLGGLALGLLAVLKTAALWLWPLLLIGRQWRLVAWAALTAFVVVLLSLPRIGLAPWQVYLTQLPQLASMPERAVTAYQTVTSLFLHLFAYHARFNPTPAFHWPGLAVALTLVVQLTTFGLTAYWQQLHDDRLPVRALSLALAAALMTANAPLGESYHYVLVLPSLLVALWWAWQARAGKVAWLALGGVIVLIAAPLPYTDPRLAAGWWSLLAYPRVYGAYLLWGWLAWALHGSPVEERARANRVAS